MVVSRFHPDRKNKCIAHVHFGAMWNTLPNRVKNYICDIEQRCDPTGEIQMIASLTEQRDALVQLLIEIKPGSSVSANNYMGQIPSNGRIVNFVNGQGVKRSAIITHVGVPDDENSWVNVRVFTDDPGNLPHETSVPKNTAEEQGSYTWDWPARV